jgi:hypothetical protein
MKTRTFVTTLFAAALIAAPATGLAGQGQGRGQQGADRHAPQERAQAERGQRDMGSDRLRQQDRSGIAEQDRDRIQDRTHAPAGVQQDANNIYGYNLMSEEERNVYRERIRTAENAQERANIEAQHRKEMQIRAESKGMKIEDPVRTQAGRDDS